MTITYRVGSGLYINITNRCTNDCEFCIRKYSDSVGSADSLWLDIEPSREEVLEDILKHDLTEYEEVVFCGYGEPTARLDELIWLCAELKKVCSLPIRINTNGHANLIAGYDTAPLFKNLVDRMSISLNAPNMDEYNKICNPVFKKTGYQGVLAFAESVKNYVPDVVLSVVGGTTDIESCRIVAERMGLPLRVR
jgi:TatD family-associated radical SAM protein